MYGLLLDITSRATRRCSPIDRVPRPARAYSFDQKVYGFPVVFLRTRICSSDLEQHCTIDHKLSLSVRALFDGSGSPVEEATKVRDFLTYGRPRWREMCRMLGAPKKCSAMSSLERGTAGSVGGDIYMRMTRVRNWRKGACLPVVSLHQRHDRRQPAFPEHFLVLFLVG